MSYDDLKALSTEELYALPVGSWLAPFIPNVVGIGGGTKTTKTERLAARSTR